MRLVVLTSILALAATSTAAVAQPAPAASAPAAGHYSTSTTDIGTLLDDPAAKAILVKHLPEIATSDQIDMVRGMTLKDTQQFAPDKVSDKALADIDAELAKLPPKK
jgi:para-nitrobenzyl esterase